MVEGMMVTVANGVKLEEMAAAVVSTTTAADSPTSVLAEEKIPEAMDDTAGDFVDASSSLPIELEAKNGDVSFITEVMTKEEEQLYRERLKVEEEEEAKKREEAARLAFDPKARFSKLDDLLTQTQLYSEFLLEKMEQITDKVVEIKEEEESVEEKKKGRARKRKVNSKPQYNDHDV